MKVSLDKIKNDYCPQTLFLFGTYKENGDPNFGLFCWFSYCWDGELCVMTCIGGEKLTKDIIMEKQIFSANLVTQKLLPVADYFGNKSGYEPDKMKVDIAVEKGRRLDVPVLADSPWVYELKVKRTVEMNGGDLFICSIENILADEELIHDNKSPLPIHMVQPVVTTGMTYFSIDSPIAMWGDWKK